MHSASFFIGEMGVGPGCDPSVRVRGKKRGGLKEERGEESNGRQGRVSDGRRQVSGGVSLGAW